MKEGPISISRASERTVQQIQMGLCIRGVHGGFSRTPILYATIDESNSWNNLLH